MDALEGSWGRLKSDTRVRMIALYIERSGLYVFLISFACVYYVSNASILLGHYDLGWHLAAGDYPGTWRHSVPGFLVFHAWR